MYLTVLAQKDSKDNLVQYSGAAVRQAFSVCERRVYALRKAHVRTAHQHVNDMFNQQEFKTHGNNELL